MIDVKCTRCDGSGKVSSLLQPPFGDLSKKLSDLGKHVYRLNSQELIDVVKKTAPSAPAEWEEGGRMLVQRLIAELLSYEWKFASQEKHYNELKLKITGLTASIESFRDATNEKLSLLLLKTKWKLQLNKLWKMFKLIFSSNDKKGIK